MSRLSDYSKFDNLVVSDDDEEQNLDNQNTLSTNPRQQQQQHATPQQPVLPTHQPVQQQQPPTKVSRTKAGSEKGRYTFEYQGRTIYEWEQSLEGALCSMLGFEIW